MTEDEDKAAILRRRARIVGAALAGLVVPACAPSAPAEPPQPAAGSATSKLSPTGDRDGDGIRDELDQCPSAPEDIDRLADTDGCPESDFDLDGVADKDDRCPTVAGSKDVARLELLGCPAQPCLTIIPQTDIQILLRIEFAPNSSEVAASSDEVLDQLVAALKKHSELAIEIHGHTDNTEQPAVAKTRAEAVKAALLKRGLDDQRVVAVKGFGADKPLEQNDTPASRAKNRRVEFKVVVR